MTGQAVRPRRIICRLCGHPQDVHDGRGCASPWPQDCDCAEAATLAAVESAG